MEIPASQVSLSTRNPIRAIVDSLKVVPNPSKEFISLALGDPTVFGNFKLDPTCVDAVIQKLQSYKSNGYPPSIGTLESRSALASHYTNESAPLTAQDVIITSGCSDALNLCIGVIANKGQNILLPAPGFSLYETLASSKGIECRFYNLIPERAWEIDLSHLESLIDSSTAAILINNPSNPCGSVYSKKHLMDILSVADKFQLPIISDEIYADMGFKGHEFIPLATLTRSVPVLSTGGLAKRWLVPGWRVGWIFIHDRGNRLAQVRKGLVNLSQLILGSNSLIQSVIPEFLKAPQTFFDATMQQLEENANASRDLLTGIPGIQPIFPQGAMYLMLKIDMERFQGISSDVEFVEKLAAEESVLALPGQCFRCPGSFVRIVFTAPKEKLKEAFKRIRAFCEKNYSSP